MTKKADLHMTYDFDKKVSRLFIFRPLWAFVLIIPLYIWAIWVAIVSFIHFFYMLLLGQRNEKMWTIKTVFMRHVQRWMSYINGLTDLRPTIIDWNDKR